MELDFTSSLADAYKEISTSGIVTTLVPVGIGIAICIFAYNLYQSYKQIATSNDAKEGFKSLLKQVAIIMIFTTIFPVLLTQIELLLASMQDAVLVYLNDNLENVYVDVQDQFIDKYVDALKLGDEDTSWWEYPQEINAYPIKVIQKLIGTTAQVGGMTFGLWIAKYIYYMFSAGRYLWLIMLEIVAPIVFAFSLNEKTRQYFFTWLKYMLCNYLLIPFFLLAETFSNVLFKLLSESNIMGVLEGSIGFVILIIIIKLALFKKVSTYVFKLF